MATGTRKSARASQQRPGESSGVTSEGDWPPVGHSNGSQGAAERVGHPPDAYDALNYLAHASTQAGSAVDGRRGYLSPPSSPPSQSRPLALPHSLPARMNGAVEQANHYNLPPFSSAVASASAVTSPYPLPPVPSSSSSSFTPYSAPAPRPQPVYTPYFPSTLPITLPGQGLASSGLPPLPPVAGTSGIGQAHPRPPYAATVLPGGTSSSFQTSSGLPSSQSFVNQGGFSHQPLFNLPQFTSTPSSFGAFNPLPLANGHSPIPLLPPLPQIPPATTFAEISAALEAHDEVTDLDAPGEVDTDFTSAFPIPPSLPPLPTGLTGRRTSQSGRRASVSQQVSSASLDSSARPMSARRAANAANRKGKQREYIEQLPPPPKKKAPRPKPAPAPVVAPPPPAPAVPPSAAEAALSLMGMAGLAAAAIAAASEFDGAGPSVEAEAQRIAMAAAVAASGSVGLGQPPIASTSYSEKDDDDEGEYDGGEYERGEDGEIMKAGAPPRKKRKGTGRSRRSRAKGKGKAATKEKEEKKEEKVVPLAPPPSHSGFVLQTLTCANKAQSNPLASILGLVPKCHECTTRRTGYSCLFRNLRSFPVDPDTGLPIPSARFLHSLENDDVPAFPVEFDRPFTTKDAEVVKSAAAHYLVPWLRRELDHAGRDACPKIKRDLGETSTCDSCAHAIVCGSWICTCCGREVCFECAEMLDAVVVNEAHQQYESDLTVQATDSSAPPAELIEPFLNYDPPSAEKLAEATALPPQTVHKLRLCMRARHPRHVPVDLIPLTRIRREELERVVVAMEAWNEAHPFVEPEKGVDPEWVKEHEVRVDGEEGRRSYPVVYVPGQLLPPRLDEEVVRAEFEGGKPRYEEDPEDVDDEWTTIDPFSNGAMRIKLEDGGGAASETTPPNLPLEAAAAAFRPAAGDLPPSSPTALPPHLSLDPDPLPDFSALSISDPKPQLTLFRRLWSLGTPFVVSLSPSSPSGFPSLPWDPPYFITHYSSEPCTVGSNRPSATLPATLVPLSTPVQTGLPSSIGGAAAASGEEKTERERERERMEARRGEERRSTVGEFFETFGRRGAEGEDGREEGISEKIKDWPPAVDFKSKYPELWEDFMNAIPAGSITRRDGVLNLSAHSPLNSNPPDLGPKGYFSHISDDKEGGWGSTKLHMDVADAVNLMVWSSPGPDGGPGVAIWDMYRAEDAPKIRDFLYERIATMEGYEGGGEEAKLKHDDPIHTQEFFLDAKLRKELYEQTGVKSFRIHQRPGQVVFIPAGCAHQVCNYADCIKVASDFISFENVGRCWKVSDEFRAQTRHKDLWRSDVLQLKSALLWAWYSAERFEWTPFEPSSAAPLPSTEEQPDFLPHCAAQQQTNGAPPSSMQEEEDGEDADAEGEMDVDA